MDSVQKTSVPTEKGKTMEIREKLVEILRSKDRCPENVKSCGDCPYHVMAMPGHCDEESLLADRLITNGVTFSAAVPGHEDQYNIAEMSYNNGYKKGFADGKNESVKRGRWIIHSSGHGKNATNWAECSECRVCGSPQWKVCPVCETKMEDT